MSSVAFARIARARLASTPICRVRPTRVQSVKPAACVSPFSTRSAGLRMPDADPHDPHHEESFEEFTARYGTSYTLSAGPMARRMSKYEKEFDSVQDVFELQRNLNNAFAYDLVPSPSVIIAALKAARRVNDFPTAVRIFEGIRAKVENVHQYNEYLSELQTAREEMGVILKEDLFPNTMGGERNNAAN
ncbi:Cytochrome c oxidase subunit 6 [Elasticomyces elasticus]|nr:Cytochrome c oxidase subunit 6 [Elasticomyces elasticus]